MDEYPVDKFGLRLRIGDKVRISFPPRILENLNNIGKFNGKEGKIVAMGLGWASIELLNGKRISFFPTWLQKIF